MYHCDECDISNISQLKTTSICSARDQAEFIPKETSLSKNVTEIPYEKNVMNMARYSSDVDHSSCTGVKSSFNLSTRGHVMQFQGILSVITGSFGRLSFHWRLDEFYNMQGKENHFIVPCRWENATEITRTNSLNNHPFLFVYIRGDVSSRQ
jgi:hypothetical protein